MERVELSSHHVHVPGAWNVEVHPSERNGRDIVETRSRVIARFLLLIIICDSILRLRCGRAPYECERPHKSHDKHLPSHCSSFSALSRIRTRSRLLYRSVSFSITRPALRGIPSLIRPLRASQARPRRRARPPWRCRCPSWRGRAAWTPSRRGSREPCPSPPRGPRSPP